jgi:iron complex outermembrane receptor protein
LDASIGWTQKDFGANGFYGPYPSYESTKALLASLRFGWSLNPGWALHVQAYAKRHDDRFTLDRERPQWYVNRHRTWSAGAAVSVNHKISDRAEAVLGLEAERLELKSTNLFNRSDNRFACFGEIGLTLTDNTIIGAGFRIDTQNENDPEF